ncbi:MAG: DUF423 domain-containing protein [Leptolyngbyaceae bacterium]|nr:DUF423 domain-containing protein [Leptolyngbyaceae bacterium]
MMVRLFLVLGAIAGGLAVALGAFASHALKSRLLERSLAIFETGVRYQMYHALALLLVGMMLSLQAKPSLWLNLSGIGFLSGMLIFSGSLYALALFGIKWMGAITPIGGVAFLFGWGCLAIAAFNIQLSPNL